MNDNDWMKKFRRGPRGGCALSLCFLLWVGCWASPRSHEENHASGAPSSDAQSLEQLPAEARALIGTWKIVIDEEKKRRIRVMELATMDPPPSPERLMDEKLDEKEVMVIQMTQEMRLKNPEDANFLRLKENAKALPSSTLEITADRLSRTVGSRTETESWWFEKVEADHMVIRTRSSAGKVEKVDVYIKGPDHIKFVMPEKKYREDEYTRRTGS